MAEDLAAWLTQIWDEQEAAARKAGGDGRWFADAAGDVYEHVREHIDLHNPAAALARIAADRQILALHKPNGRNILGYPVCDACTPLKPTPCPTVRLLALPYADRPGYREEWRP